jgi:hypothetical protein
VTRPGSLPGATFAAWYASWPWYPTLALALVFTPLLFPTGRLLSSRWRPLAWLAGAATAAFTVLAAVQADLGSGRDAVIANPIGVAAVENPEESTVGAALLGLIVLSAVAAFVSLVLRFRRSRGEERQQLKWFTYAGALIPLSWLGDIERLINRTLVYGSLTALLAGTYAVLVLVLGQVDGMGRDPPSWVVAGATLAVAALFRPARRRIQAVVDRRFNRRKDDAARTIQAFTAHLRDQIDLGTLSTELLAVVDQTMEPTRVSLWLRPAPHGSSSTPPSAARPITWTY